MEELGRVIITVSIFCGSLPGLLLYFKHVYQPEIEGFLKALLVLVFELLQYIRSRQSLSNVKIFSHQRHINIIFAFFSVAFRQLGIDLVDDGLSFIFGGVPRLLCFCSFLYWEFPDEFLYVHILH